LLFPSDKSALNASSIAKTNTFYSPRTTTSKILVNNKNQNEEVKSSGRENIEEPKDESIK